MPCKKKLVSNLSSTEWIYLSFQKCNSTTYESNYGIAPGNIREIVYEDGTFSNPFEGGPVQELPGGFINFPPQRTRPVRVTPTPTPSSTCDCRNVVVDISNSDIVAADDGKVYFVYTSCQGVSATTVAFSSASESVYCVKNSFVPYLYFFNNGVQKTPSNSEFTYDDCCGLAPTQTKTPTPTPTQTSNCGCHYNEFTITQSNLNSASGNTDTTKNGKVFYFYTECGQTGFTENSYSIAGTYTVCSKDFVEYNLGYFQNDGFQSLYNNVLVTDLCCFPPTPTLQTPTPTPTEHCPCYNDLIFISQQDIDSASGNTFSGSNGVVYYEHTPCGSTGVTTSEYFESYQYPSCHEFNTTYRFYYYQNNLIQTGTTSYREESSVCCTTHDCKCYEIANPTSEVKNINVLACTLVVNRGLAQIQPYSVQYLCLDEFYSADVELNIRLISDCESSDKCGPIQSTPTPTPGLSPTPTPTPGLSPTPTPTLSCGCHFANVFIYSSDTINATGNTDNDLNGVIFLNYLSCDGQIKTHRFNSLISGQYIRCINDNFNNTIFYYNNDTLVSSGASYIQTTNVECCNNQQDCNCYTVKNTTNEIKQITYSPCGSQEYGVIGILPNSTYNFCGTLIRADIDLTVEFGAPCFSGNCDSSDICNCVSSTLILSFYSTYFITGNTNPSYNNAFFYTAQNCGSVTGTTTYRLTGGVFAHCHEKNTPYSLGYWVNDTFIDRTTGTTRNYNGGCNCDNYPTSTPTPTPTTTSTMTPTPTPTCNCESVDIVIDQIDIDMATGNTTYSQYDGTVIVDIEECGHQDKEPLTKLFYTSAGTYNLCAKSDPISYVYVYRGDEQTNQVDSYVDQLGINCCNDITPTPTPTPTGTLECIISGTSQFSGFTEN